MTDTETIQQVETFVRRLHDLEIVISPQASKLIYVKPTSPTGFQSGFAFKFPKEERQTFADFFARSLFDYLNCDSKFKKKQAEILSIWIERAYANGFVNEGTGNLKKLDEYKTKNAQLEKDLQVLSVKYNELAKEHKELTKHFAKLPKKK